jgi:transposase
MENLVLHNEILRLACHLARPIRPIDISRHFNVSYLTAIRWLNQLCEKGWLRPHLNKESLRTAQYEMIPDVLRYWT